MSLQAKRAAASALASQEGPDLDVRGADTQAPGLCHGEDGEHSTPRQDQDPQSTSALTTAAATSPEIASAPAQHLLLRPQQLVAAATPTAAGPITTEQDAKDIGSSPRLDQGAGADSALSAAAATPAATGLAMAETLLLSYQQPQAAPTLAAAVPPSATEECTQLLKLEQPTTAPTAVAHALTTASAQLTGHLTAAAATAPSAGAPVQQPPAGLPSSDVADAPTTASAQLTGQLKAAAATSPSAGAPSQQQPAGLPSSGAARDAMAGQTIPATRSRDREGAAEGAPPSPPAPAASAAAAPTPAAPPR